MKQVSIDLNCDMGEGMGNDAHIMPFISSANIACGYHAGDPGTIWETIQLSLKHSVAIGAHVSFLDKKNFGRSEIIISESEIYELVQQQLIIFKEIADTLDAKINHVKPHGALYNLSAKKAGVAKAIARAIKDFDSDLILFGLSDSHSIVEATKLRLPTAHEIFVDRTYQDDGTLTKRSEAKALISDSPTAIRQLLQFLAEGTITTVTGNKIMMVGETVCIHGDGNNAVEMASAINSALKQNNIDIKAF